MESIDTELAARIRNDIVLGNYGEEERISEARLCDTHKVSRTPVRLALRMLEHEGLIRRSEGRGYFVNAPKVNDVLQAVQVRGHLESLAARLMAQSPDRHSTLPILEAAIEKSDSLVSAGKMDHASIRVPCRNRMQCFTKRFWTVAAMILSALRVVVSVTCRC